jgi:hypothetical protein
MCVCESALLNKEYQCTRTACTAEGTILATALSTWITAEVPAPVSATSDLKRSTKAFAIDRWHHVAPDCGNEVELQWV